MSPADPHPTPALHPVGAAPDLSAREPRPFNAFDYLVYGFLLLAGAFYFFLRLRAPDFRYDDVFYFQRALSLLRLGYDGFNGTPETTQMPGLPYLFASFCLVAACRYQVCLASFPVFTTFGLLVTYTLFRLYIPRLVAFLICLLLVAAPSYFSLSTAWIATTFPVFFTSMTALLVTTKLDEATRLRSRILWASLLAFLVSWSIMIAAAALSLVGAIVAKIAATSFRDRRLALSHLKNYAAALFLALAVQGLWAHRKPMPIEWPIQGFPHPYLQQLPLKSGPNPDLGYASARDVVQRAASNLREETNLLLQFIYTGWINLAFPSAALAGPLLLILLGWADSLWRTRGDTLAEWYFAAYQVMYLFWPWKMEARYFFPVAPLALLYLWSSAQALFSLAKNRPRLLGAIWLPVSAMLVAACMVWLREDPRLTHSLPGGMQAELSLVFWSLSGVLAVWMVWKDSSWHSFLTALAAWFSRPLKTLKLRPLHLASAFALLFFGFTAFSGFAVERRIARQNLDLHSPLNRVPPDMEAALWFRAHTPPGAIVMARQIPTVSYHSGRKVIWLPPTGNPRLLIEGIREYKVEYIAVIRRADSYFLPPDEDCMAALLANYPNSFRLLSETPGFRIFQVLRDNLPATSQGRFFDN